VNHARRDLCGGHPAMDVPTAIAAVFLRLRDKNKSIDQLSVFFETDNSGSQDFLKLLFPEHSRL
jgi:hypothetical protein